MIVVSTPTGQIGRQVLARIVEADRPVRVIARDPARLDPGVRERVEVVAGSMADPEVVGAALKGADTVFWLVPPNPRAESLALHVLDLVRPLCEGLARHDVRRVVGVSSLGRGVARDAGQISAIFALDHLVESTGVSYRALCPPGFMENLLHQLVPLREQGVFYTTLPADRAVPTCATRDIAAAAADLLLDDAWDGQASVPLLGPEDLSGDDQARILSEVLGRPVRCRPVPADAYRDDLVRHGMSAPWAQGIVGMAAAVARGAYDAEPRTGRAEATPTTFRAWSESVLRPLI